MSLMSLPPEDRLMSMEQWWNDNDGGNPTYLDRDLSYCQFVHHTFRMNYCGSKPISSLWEADELTVLAVDYTELLPHATRQSSLVTFKLSLSNYKSE
jgi:hypothetical protein